MVLVNTGPHTKKNLSENYPLYVRTVDSCTKYFVARQQCKLNPVLHLHGYTQRFYIVDSYMQVSNNTRGKHCCVLMATMVMRTRHNITYAYNAYTVVVCSRSLISMLVCLSRSENRTPYCKDQVRLSTCLSVCL
jgi:hypothetical protein